MKLSGHEPGAVTGTEPSLGPGSPDARWSAPGDAADAESGTITSRLERIVAGDREARAWLYDRFAARLFRALRARYGHERDLDPEELLQDAFLFFFQHDARVLASFLASVPPAERSPSRLDAHLWGLACGIASNRRRSSRRRRTLSLSETDAIADAADAERRNLDRDVLSRLTDCLARAGSRVFLYYKLRFVDGLTPEEISRVTGWPLKATYKLKLSLNDAVDRCAKRLRIT
jgi:DNA-directed RNA polymerase specialized sigma24 family protein